jgi:hypothetical protein
MGIKRVINRLGKPTPPFFKKLGNALAATFGTGGIGAAIADVSIKIVIACFVLGLIGKFMTEFATEPPKDGN